MTAREPCETVAPDESVLSEEETAQIRAEEKIREEVRAEGRKTSFFNKPLGVFILSTLLVGAASYWFTRYETQQKEAEAQRSALDRERGLKTEAQRKLDIEFAHRFNKVESYLADAESRMPKNLDDSQFVYTHVAHLLDGQEFHDEKDVRPMKAAFPEHRERELQPMIFDLQSVVWESTDRSALDGLIAKYKELRRLSQIPPDRKNILQGETAAIAWCRQMLADFRNTRKQWAATQNA